MTRVVARVTAAQPWLIILEDLQWADAASLQLLAHVITETAQLPLMILMTVRDSALPREQRLAARFRLRARSSRLRAHRTHALAGQ